MNFYTHILAYLPFRSIYKIVPTPLKASFCPFLVNTLRQLSFWLYHHRLALPILNHTAWTLVEYHYVYDIHHVVLYSICHLLLCGSPFNDYTTVYPFSYWWTFAIVFTNLNKVAMTILIMPFSGLIDSFLHSIYLGI